MPTGRGLGDRAFPAQAGTSTPLPKGESRGGIPLCGCRAASRLGDVPPECAVPLQRPNLPPQPAEGGAGGTTRMCSPTSTPQSAVAQVSQLWVQGLAPAPALVSLCRFRAIFRRGPRPTFSPRPRRYDLFPFCRRFNTPRQGPRPLIRPVPGSYGLSPFVDLSVAPQTQAGTRFPRHGPPEKSRRTIQSNSDPSLHPTPARCGCRPC